MSINIYNKKIQAQKAQASTNAMQQGIQGGKLANALPQNAQAGELASALLNAVGAGVGAIDRHQQQQEKERLAREQELLKQKQAKEKADRFNAELTLQEMQMTFESEYTNTRKGRDGINAKNDFMENINTNMDLLLETDLAELSEEEKENFRNFGRQQALSSFGRGNSFGTQQDNEYKNATIKSARALHEQLIAKNSTDTQAIAESRQNLINMQNELFTGVDNDAVFADWDNQDAQHIILTSLADKKLTQARKQYAQMESILGDDAPKIKKQINALADAFARENAQRAREAKQKRIYYTAQRLYEEHANDPNSAIRSIEADDTLSYIEKRETLMVLNSIVKQNEGIQNFKDTQQFKAEQQEDIEYLSAEGRSIEEMIVYRDELPAQRQELVNKYIERAYNGGDNVTNEDFKDNLTLEITRGNINASNFEEVITNNPNMLSRSDEANFRNQIAKQETLHITKRSEASYKQRMLEINPDLSSTQLNQLYNEVILEATDKGITNPNDIEKILINKSTAVTYDPAWYSSNRQVPAQAVSGLLEQGGKVVVPNEQRTQIISALQSAGKAVTEANIQQAYLNSLK